jgi:hypothetical protein
LLLGAASAGVAAAAAAAAQPSPENAAELLETITSHQIHEIAADLMAWLQQRPALITQHGSSDGDCAYYSLWYSCAQCLAAVAKLCNKCGAEERVGYATELAYVQHAAGDIFAAAAAAAGTCRLRL